MTVVNLTGRDVKRLQGVHSDLCQVVYRAAELYQPRRFMVLEGLRSKTRQAQLVKSGASRTMNSRHLTGHAVDLAPVTGGVIPWDKWEEFDDLAKMMMQAAAELKIKIEWGGNFPKFKDGPHFQLPW